MHFYSITKVSGRIMRVASVAVVAAGALALSSCTDDKYDLSDIDTTVRVQVKDLTLPVNIDQIQLKSILDLKEDGIIKEINDEYVLLRDGDFSSSALKVDPISIAAPTSNPSVTTFLPDPSAAARRHAPGQEVVFNIANKETSAIHYSYDGVSDDIVSIDRLGAEWTINYYVTLAAADNSTKNFTLRNFEFQLPKGLTGTPSMGAYDPNTGVIRLQDRAITDGKLEFHMNITAVDAAQAQVKFNPANHHLEIDNHTGVINGQIAMNVADLISGNVPSQIKVTTQLVLSRIEVKTFTGSVKYDIDDINIAPVELNDLPDVLAQEGTDIRLVNPQIYLNLNNPFSQYGIHASTGFALNALRNGQQPVHSAIDAGTFEIASSAESFYCISPSHPEHYYQGYENATHIPFTSLSTALAGNGLPTKIDIDLDPTVVPVQHVSDFRLGSYPGVEGKYVFYAPLALGAGSTIVYTSTEDGWNDEDVDKITITTLEVTASLTNTLPFDITMTGYPIDKDGKQINDVQIEGAVVKAGATDTPITIHITGTVTHLDGIRFTACANTEKNSGALSPSETIVLKNVRAKVSGYYDDEL